MKIFSTDIKDKKVFNFENTTLTMIKDYGNNFYLYERKYTDSGRLLGYELVRGVKKKNPDGNIVYVYPSSEQFGKNGWFYPSSFTISQLDKKYEEKNF